MASGNHGNHNERVKLLEQRAQLSQELSSLRLAVTQLERDVGRLRGDIVDVGRGARLEVVEQTNSMFSQEIVHC